MLIGFGWCLTFVTALLNTLLNFVLEFSTMTDKNKKLARWYFGGLGSAGAACCTHPLDLLKVKKFIFNNAFGSLLCVHFFSRFNFKLNKKGRSQLLL